MTRTRFRGAAVALLLALLPAALWAQVPVGTAFTYQGRLTEAGAPAEGAYDFQFSLYDDPDYGILVAGPLQVLGQEVVYGLFATTLDFGPVFAGEARWLEVRVRPTGGANYTVLLPRHALTPTPFALFALSGNEGPEGPEGPPGEEGPPGPPGDSHWLLNGDATYYDQGPVGIGTATPGADFDVRGLARVEALKIGNEMTAPAGVIAWGHNGWGQCNVPVPSGNIVQVAAGGRHSVGLNADASIVAWGSNYEGQCNIPDPNTGFVAVAAGYYHSLGLRAGGVIVPWGLNDFGQCDVPEPNSEFVGIDGGAFYSVGLKGDGSIVAWGQNSFGECDVPGPNNGFVAVAAGYYHTLGLKADGSIVAWGRGDYGQCDVPTPNSDFVAVVAGAYHSAGLKSDGSVLAWGGNYSGQCDVPAPNSGFVALATFGDHNLGLKVDGSIVAWGENGSGQCDIPAPNNGFVAVSGGAEHSLAIRGAAASATLIVEPGGSVGIGTESPQSPLEVAGTIHSTAGGFMFPDGTVQTTAATGGGDLPTGAIVMWSGSVASIPAGWHLCDGTAGTPDLRDRFILAAPAGQEPGAAGGAHECVLTASNMPAHNHPAYAGDNTHSHEFFEHAHAGVQPAPLAAGPGYDIHFGFSATVPSTHGHTVVVSPVGDGVPFDNRPAYYTLAFIMKL